MNLTGDLWNKVLKLEKEYQQRDETLSRYQIRDSLKINEHEARFLWELLKNYPVVMKAGGQREFAALASQNRKLKNSVREVSREIERLVRIAEFHGELKNQTLSIPAWAAPGRSKNTAIACAMLSDTHFDEVVNPAEIGYVNAYNRSIATARLERYFKSLVKLKDVHLSGIKIDGLVLMMAGDMVSGMIHEELAATNEFPITDTIIYYTEQLSAGINLLLDHYEKLFVPCVVGNHGRLTPKVKFKGVATDNFDYLLYSMVAAQFKNRKGVQFYIPVSSDALFPVGNTKFCLSHGNQFKGGSGWAGPLMPVMRGDTKKRTRQEAVKRPYDVLCTAHFHSLKFLGQQILNGSVIGYGDFAAGNNFGFEPPRQAFFLVDERHGVTITSPVHCKADVEPWEEKKEIGMIF